MKQYKKKYKKTRTHKGTIIRLEEEKKKNNKVKRREREREREMISKGEKTKATEDRG